MPRGRARRLRHFDEHAKNFEKYPRRAPVTRDSRTLERGHGNNRRLVLKSPRNFRFTNAFQDKFVPFVKEHKTPPKHFVMAPVASVVLEKFGVQEYFHKPSMETALEYLTLAEENPSKLLQ